MATFVHRAEYSKVARELASKKQEILAWEIEHSQLERKYKLLQDEAHAMSLAACDERSSVQGHSKDESTRRREIVDAKVQELTAERDHLVETLAAVREKASAAEQELSDTNDAFRVYRAGHDSLAQQVTALREELAGAEERARASTGEGEALRAQRDEAIAGLASAVHMERVAEVEVERVRSAAGVAQARTAMDAQLAEHAGRLVMVEEELKVAQGALRESGRVAEEREEECSRTQAALSAAERQLDAVKGSAHAEVARLRSAADAQLAGSAGRLVMVEGELDVASREARRVAEALEEETSRLTAAQRHLASLRTALAQREAELEEAKGARAVLDTERQRAITAGARAIARLAEFARLLHSARSELAERSVELASANGECDELKRELLACQVQARQAATEAAAATGACAESSAALQAWRAQSQERAEQLAATREECEELNASCKQLKEALQASHAQEQKQVVECEELHVECVELKEALHAQAEEHAVSLASVDRERGALEEALSASQAKANARAVACEQANRECGRLNEELRAFQSAAADRAAELAAAIGECDELKKALRASQAQPWPRDRAPPLQTHSKGEDCEAHGVLDPSPDSPTRAESLSRSVGEVACGVPPSQTCPIVHSPVASLATALDMPPLGGAAVTSAPADPAEDAAALTAPASPSHAPSALFQCEQAASQHPPGVLEGSTARSAVAASALGGLLARLSPGWLGWRLPAARAGDSQDKMAGRPDAVTESATACQAASHDEGDADYYEGAAVGCVTPFNLESSFCLDDLPAPASERTPRLVPPQRHNTHAPHAQGPPKDTTSLRHSRSNAPPKIARARSPTASQSVLKRRQLRAPSGARSTRASDLQNDTPARQHCSTTSSSAPTAFYALAQSALERDIASVPGSPMGSLETQRACANATPGTQPCTTEVSDCANATAMRTPSNSPYSTPAASGSVARRGRPCSSLGVRTRRARRSLSCHTPRHRVLVDQAVSFTGYTEEELLEVSDDAQGGVDDHPRVHKPHWRRTPSGALRYPLA